MLVCTIEIFINERTKLVSKIGGGTVLLLPGYKSIFIYVLSKRFQFPIAEIVYHVHFYIFVCQCCLLGQGWRGVRLTIRHDKPEWWVYPLSIAWSLIIYIVVSNNTQQSTTFHCPNKFYPTRYLSIAVDCSLK